MRFVNFVVSAGVIRPAIVIGGTATKPDLFVFCPPGECEPHAALTPSAVDRDDSKETPGTWHPAPAAKK